jgi:hypothetical protein
MTVKLTPYITLEGRVKEAVQFYEQAMVQKSSPLLLTVKCRTCPIRSLTI